MTGLITWDVYVKVSAIVLVVLLLVLRAGRRQFHDKEMSASMVALGIAQISVFWPAVFLWPLCWLIIGKADSGSGEG